ncbi:MAG TPA: permease, partial [Rhodopila sp.]|nr:permease [Rhodopila sp.]
DMASEGGTLWQKLSRRETWVRVAQSFVMDWSMLWKDLLLGFLIAGALSVFVPDGVWQALFVKGASPWIQVPANALLGPIVAVLSFVCSIGNVPMAAVLWGAGVSFGGVLAFLYADLIVLPLLDMYRRYYGWKMAAYIAFVFYTTMVVSALIMDVAFNALGWIPAARPDVHAQMAQFSLNYTFWLNIAFGLLAVALFVVARRHPMGHGHCGHHGQQAVAHQHRH